MIAKRWHEAKDENGNPVMVLETDSGQYFNQNDAQEMLSKGVIRAPNTPGQVRGIQIKNPTPEQAVAANKLAREEQNKVNLAHLSQSAAPVSAGGLGYDESTFNSLLNQTGAAGTPQAEEAVKTYHGQVAPIKARNKELGDKIDFMFNTQTPIALKLQKQAWIDEKMPGSPQPDGTIAPDRIDKDLVNETAQIDSLQNAPTPLSPLGRKMRAQQAGIDAVNNLPPEQPTDYTKPTPMQNRVMSIGGKLLNENYTAADAQKDLAESEKAQFEQDIKPAKPGIEDYLAKLAAKEAYEQTPEERLAEYEAKRKILQKYPTATVKMNMNELTPEEEKALNDAIIEGRLDSYRVNSRNQKIFASAALGSPGINLNELTAQLSYQRSPLVSNKKAILDAVNPELDNLLNLGGKLGNTKIPIVNVGLNAIKEATGNPDIVAFNNARDDAIANVERGLLGTGVLSDTKYVRAAKNVRSAQSPEQLQAAIKQMRFAISTALEATEKGPYPGAAKPIVKPSTPKPQATTISSKAEFDKLPSGSEYINANTGKKAVKP